MGDNKRRCTTRKYDVVKFNQHAKKDREYIKDVLYLRAVFVGVFH